MVYHLGASVLVAHHAVAEPAFELLAFRLFHEFLVDGRTDIGYTMDEATSIKHPGYFQAGLL